MRKLFVVALAIALAGCADPLAYKPGDSRETTERKADIAQARAAQTFYHPQGGYSGESLRDEVEDLSGRIDDLQGSMDDLSDKLDGFVGEQLKLTS
jgi:hypothetical protein